MECRVLGPIEVSIDGRAIGLGGPQQRRVLAALVADRGRILTYDRLVEVLWPDGDEPSNARRSAITYVSKLRAVLGDGVVDTTDAGYVIGAGSISVDADRFLALLDRARTVPPAEAVELLDDALALWRGPVFGELGGEWWARPTVTRLEELRLTALADRIDARTVEGWDGRAVADASALLDTHPLREQFVLRAMRGLHAIGQTADALRVFQRFRTELAERTGLDPPASLAELERSLLDGSEIEGAGPARTRSLRGYVLHELIGEGSFGAVYRATQPGVDRDVAIKAIRAELADDRTFVRRFEAEAQLVARLEHPHIVPLYDFWREPGGAYLVFRLLRGGNAHDLIERDGPLSLEGATKVLVDIASALTSAHAAGVVHRDVKPANILFDDESVAYLSDFGIAATTTPAETIQRTDPQRWSAGSLLYASPEQLRDGSDDARADQYALAVTIWELLTGRSPFVQSDSSALLNEKMTVALPSLHEHRGELPVELSAVLTRAGAVHPADRFGDVAEFVAAWHRAAVGAANVITSPAAASGAVGVAGRAAATMVVAGETVRNPYVGLRAFREGDAAEFHGREQLSDALAAAVAGSPCVVVVGPSGSGKSSLVLAGLVPRLRAAGSVVLTMTPDADPIAALASALGQVARAEHATLIAAPALRREDGIADALGALGDGTDVVLVIDQLEELWTLSGDDDRAVFLGGLRAPIDDGLVTVVATVRADFFDRPLADPVLGGLTASSAFAVTPMTSLELHRAITAPAEAVGVRFDADLVSRLVAEASGEPGSLPLLQFALAELFEHRSGPTITNESYDEIGGLAGALSRHADAIIAGLGAAQLPAARRLFSRLVNPGDGSEDTRRRVPMHELAAVPLPIITAFVDGRLLTTDRDRQTREPTFELAHEVILRSWPQLRSWLAADRAHLRELRSLTSAASAWDTGGRDDADLARGARLAAISELASNRDAGLATVERDFVERSLVVAAEHERDAQERLAAQLRQNRRLRKALTGLAAVLVIALVAAGLAVVQRRRADHQQAVATTQRAVAEQQRALADDQRAAAEEQQSIAEAARDRATEVQHRSDVRRLVAESAVARTTDLSLSLLLAAEAYQREPDVSTEGALESALVSNPSLLGFMRGDESYTSLALSRGGTELLAGGGDGHIDRWDLTTSTRAGSITASDSAVRIAVSPDGSVIAAADREGRLSLWSDESGAALTDPIPLDALADGATTATPVFSADGAEVFVPKSSGSIVAISTDGSSIGEQRTVVVGDGRKVGNPAISPSGTEMIVPVVVDGGTIELRTFDSATGEPGLSFATGLPALTVSGLRWSPDGSRIAVATGGGSPTGQVFDATTGAAIGARWDDVNGAVVEFRPDGSILDVSSSGKVQQRSADGELLENDPLMGGGATLGLAVDPGAGRLYASDTAGTITVVDLTGDHSKLGTPFGADIIGLAVAHDGASLAIIDGQLDLTIRALDGSVISGPYRLPPETRTPTGATVEFDPTDTKLAVATIAGRVDIIDATNGATLRTFDVPARTNPTSRFAQAYGSAAALFAQIDSWSPDGRTLAVTGLDRVLLFDTSTGQLLHELVGWADVLLGRNGFSPDGTLYAAASFDGTARIARVDDGTFVDPPLAEGGFRIGGVGWLPDGRLVLSNWKDSTVDIVDPISRESAGPSSHPFGGAALQPTALPDGSVVVVGSTEGKVRLIDVATGALIGEPLPSAVSTTVGFVVDGGNSIIVLGDPFIRYDISPDHWASKACAVAGRNLTSAEWELHFPDEPYHVTCPAFPAGE